MLEFDFKYDGMGLATLAFNNLSGIGRSGTGVLKVEGKEVATQKMERTLPLILQWDENFDRDVVPTLFSKSIGVMGRAEAWKGRWGVFPGRLLYLPRGVGQPGGGHQREDLRSGRFYHR